MKQCERCNDPATVVIETTSGTQQTALCEDCSTSILQRARSIWRVKEQVSEERQAYRDYLAECEKTDCVAQGSLLRLMTPREMELYDAWQATLKEDEE